MQGSSISPAAMIYPTNGETNVDVRQPFQWNSVAIAQGYRLQISSNGSVIQDSGVITIPRYFAEDLSVGPYSGTLGTEIAGQWYTTTFSFTVTNSGYSMANEIAAAQWATNFVRTMADASNHVYPWTELHHSLLAADPGDISAECDDYALTLQRILLEMNLTARLPASEAPQLLNITFDNNGFDGHTLVQVYDTDDQDWILLDPTFDLMVKRTSDGDWATAEDVHDATLSQDWSAISYVFLGSFGDSLVESYYIDYPLLYLNIPPLPEPADAGVDPRSYMTALSEPPTNQLGVYAITSTQTSVQVLVDGQMTTIECDGAGGLSQLFYASTISLPAGSTAQIQVYQVERYVF